MKQKNRKRKTGKKPKEPAKNHKKIGKKRKNLKSSRNFLKPEKTRTHVKWVVAQQDLAACGAYSLPHCKDE
jgi:hypothetical protein